MLAQSDTPPRFRTRTIAGGIVIATLLLLLLRLIWGGVAQHRLNQQLSAAKGDPLTPQELFGASDPDPAANAVPLLTEAMSKAKTVRTYSPAQSVLEYKDYPPYPPEWHKMADAAVAAGSEPLSLARQARGRPKFHWNVQIQTPVSQNLPFFPGLNTARNLANLIGDAALHAHLRGDDVEALARIRDMLHLADAVDAQRTLVSHLVADGIDSLALHRLMVIAPGLKIASNDQSAPLRQQVFAILRQLLDTSADERSLRQTIVAERVYQIDGVRWETRNVWAIGPMYELELARILDADQTLLRAATQPSFPAARAVVAARPLPPLSNFSYLSGRVPPPEKAPPRFSRQLSNTILQGLDRIIEIDVRYRTERRMAAISLAAQLYRADHGGSWPPTLDALVPTYLPKIPHDPLASNHRPIQYLLLRRALPDGGDRPLIYSVGPDGDDDTSAGAHKPPEQPEYGWAHTRPPLDDQHRDLSRWSPPPATQPTEDEPPATLPTD